MLHLVELYYPRNFGKWKNDALHRYHRLWYLDEALIALQLKRVPIEAQEEIQMALCPEPHERKLKENKKSIWKLFCC